MYILYSESVFNNYKFKKSKLLESYFLNFFKSFPRLLN